MQRMTYSRNLKLKALKYLDRYGSPCILLNWKKWKKQDNLAPKLKRKPPSKLNNEKLNLYV